MNSGPIFAINEAMICPYCSKALTKLHRSKLHFKCEDHGTFHMYCSIYGVLLLRYEPVFDSVGKSRILKAVDAILTEWAYSEVQHCWENPKEEFLSDRQDANHYLDCFGIKHD
jgi:hypothetical protein